MCLYCTYVYIRTDQLSEIRKTTFAAIICDNSDKIESVQLHVMLSSRKVGNDRVGCDSLIKMSLDRWKEEYVAGPAPPTTIATATSATAITISNNNGSQSADL